jgi:hypothetical protein
MTNMEIAHPGVLPFDHVRDLAEAIEDFAAADQRYASSRYARALLSLWYQARVNAEASLKAEMRVLGHRTRFGRSYLHCPFRAGSLVARSERIAESRVTLAECACSDRRMAKPTGLFAPVIRTFVRFLRSWIQFDARSSSDTT